jgi:tetratricopeptide (TPR) repeat protein
MAKFPRSLGRSAFFVGTLAIIELFVASCSKSGGIATNSAARSKVYDAPPRSVSVKPSPDPAAPISQVAGSSAPQNNGTNALDPKKDLEICGGDSAHASLQTKIDACTRLINTRRLGRAKLVRAYVHRGSAYGESFADRKHNHYLEAVADLTAAIRLRPDCADAFFMRGHSYSDMGFEDKAIADFTRAIQLYPTGATMFRKTDALNSRGISYDGKGLVWRAIADYNQALRLAPNGWMPLCNRSHAYRSLGRNALADADRDKANSLNGSDRLRPFSPEMDYAMTCK